ncbi:MAG: tyrosine--tRNA ligase [Pseudomonadaceae bacterium]|nr:tyrosine--tRNA ligase [Pseudomonadaceae bacterium]
MNFIADLQARGLLAQASDIDATAEYLAGGSRTAYCGFDPTADSLHIGSLVPLLALRRLQLAGHRPILLVGGATGLIGDPSGRSDERNLNTSEVVAGWVASIQRQASALLDMDGPNGALVVDNLEWTAGISVLDFLRDIGKHFSVNSMIARDSVKSRLDREGAGISFTEFAYMLLQGFDFLELSRRHDCRLQIGGSDQWGNIVSGVDLIRRSTGQQAFGLTLPLVTKADGTKFGKTAGGSVWLDPKKTSPYSFYQFWLNAADDDAGRFLRFFTFIDLPDIEAIEQRAAQEPGTRLAQHELAAAVTELVHGAEALEAAKRITAALFGGDISGLTEDDLNQLALDGLPSTTADTSEIGLLSALTQAGLSKSNGAARQLVQSKAVSVNGEAVVEAAHSLTVDNALYGRFHLLRRGKKSWHLLVLSALDSAAAN